MKKFPTLLKSGGAEPAYRRLHDNTEDTHGANRESGQAAPKARQTSP